MSYLKEINEKAGELYTALSALDMSEEEKKRIIINHLNNGSAIREIDKCSRIIKQLEEDSKRYEEKKRHLEELKRNCDSAAAEIKDELAELLGAIHQTKLNSGAYTVFFRTTKALEIKDEDKIPDKFFIPQPAKLSREMLKKAIKAGEAVEGCEIRETMGVVIK